MVEFSDRDNKSYVWCIYPVLLCSKQKLQRKYGNVLLFTLLLRAGMNCFNVYTCWKTWQKWWIQCIFQSCYLLSIVFYGIKFFTASVIDFLSTCETLLYYLSGKYIHLSCSRWAATSCASSSLFLSDPAHW